MTRYQLIRRATAALLTFACATAALADSIVLRENVRLPADRSVVQLQDVAALEGEAALRLASTQLADLATAGPNGSPAATLELTVDQIRERLLSVSSAANLIDLSGRAVTIRSAIASKPVAMKALALDTRAVPPTPREATAVATSEQAPQRMEFLAEEATDLTTPRGLIAELIRNAHASRSARVRLIINGADDRFLDQRSSTRRFEVLPLTSLTVDLVRVRVLVRDGDDVVGRTDLTIEPQLEAEVATATSAVRRGAAVGSALDIRTEWVKPSEFASLATVGSINEAVATGSIGKGERLTNADLRKPIQIKRNDKVTIRRELGTVAIELAAIAVEDGAVGDLIRFRAIDRKDRRDSRIFFAEVLGNGRAVIREGKTLAAGGES